MTLSFAFLHAFYEKQDEGEFIMEKISERAKESKGCLGNLLPSALIRCLWQRCLVTCDLDHHMTSRRFFIRHDLDQKRWG